MGEGAAQHRARGVGVEHLHGVDVEVERADGELVFRIVGERLGKERAQDEADEEAGLGCRRGSERLEAVRPGRGAGLVVVEGHQLPVGAGIGARHDDRAETGIDRGRGGVRLEDDFLLQVGVIDGDLHAERQVDDERVGGLVELVEGEGELGPGRAGRLGGEADQVQEGDVVEVGDLVEAEEDRLRHPGVQLDQRHAWIAVVEVRPFRRVARDALAGLGDEIVEAAAVEVRGRQGHGAFLRPGLR